MKYSKLINNVNKFYKCSYKINSANLQSTYNRIIKSLNSMLASNNLYNKTIFRDIGSIFYILNFAELYGAWDLILLSKEKDYYAVMNAIKSKNIDNDIIFSSLKKYFSPDILQDIKTSPYINNTIPILSKKIISNTLTKLGKYYIDQIVSSIVSSDEFDVIDGLTDLKEVIKILVEFCDSFLDLYQMTNKKPAHLQNVYLEFDNKIDQLINFYVTDRVKEKYKQDIIENMEEEDQEDPNRIDDAIKGNYW